MLTKKGWLNVNRRFGPAMQIKMIASQLLAAAKPPCGA
jgi:hypothetical protein